MANTHKHAPWRKSVLVPFWTLQLLLELLLIAVLGLAEGVLVNYDDFHNDDEIIDENTINHATHIVVPIWIAFIAICLILTITEIILLARHKLKPATFVIMNVIKTGIFTIMFVLDIVSAFTQGGRTTSVVGIIIDIILLICFWVPLIYGSVIFHRTRKEAKSYKPVDHPLQNPAQGAMEYPPQYKGFVQEQGHDLEANRVAGARRLSYNNKRDTRFDSYRETYGTPPAAGLESYSGANGLASPDIPIVQVQHHDAPEVYHAPIGYGNGPDVYEMESSRRALS